MSDDQVTFRAHLSDDRTLCFFDVKQQRPGGADVRLELGRDELFQLTCTLTTMVASMSSAPPADPVWQDNTGCKHERRKPFGRTPVRYGSFEVERCEDCKSWRTTSHTPGPWRTGLVPRKRGDDE